MTFRLPQKTSTARAGGCPLARAGLLALAGLATIPAGAQTPTWEMLPIFPYDVDHQALALDFLRGEGVQAADPAADSLVAIMQPGGVVLYNPDDEAGAAGENGEVWGAWHPLCVNSQCGVNGGVVTAAGSIVIGGFSRAISRSTDRGRTWTHGVAEVRPDPLEELFAPSAAGPDGTPVLLGATGFDGETARSQGDGAPGTWVQTGAGLGYPQSFGEVPAAPALPGGRLLYGVYNGITYSDDGALTWRRSSAYVAGSFLVAWSFAFLPRPGHPYGGVAFAGMQTGESSGAEVRRSEDGGATWTLAHQFTAEETGQPDTGGAGVAHVQLLATPDGALWAGVGLTNGTPIPRRGGIMRSLDAGQTWHRADAGFDAGDGRGHRVLQLVLSRTGVLYAATEYGVWRTTAPVVASEALPTPGAVPGVRVAVRPNPASGRTTVAVTLVAAGPVRVVVLDVRGREMAVAFDGSLPAGEREVGVETGGWPAGMYFVRATAGAESATVRLTVAR